MTDPVDPTAGSPTREQASDGVNGYGDDQLMADLRNSWERLCRAQTHVPAHWKSDLQMAIGVIEQAGSSLLPAEWSRYRQPEVPEARS